MEANLTDVANALANKHPFEESSFMRTLDLEAMHAPEFSEYMNADGEFVVGMEFSSREAIIIAMKDYNIRKGVRLSGLGCDWLIRVSMISRKYCLVIRRYNGSHTCTRATISQDHSKLDSNTIAEVIKSLVETDSSIKKAWLAKQKSVEKYLEVGKHCMKFCPYGLRPCVIRSHQQSVHFETMHAYQGDDLEDETHLSEEYLSVIKSG
ncbi:hypothetical protein Ahy_A06g026491 [Arachis hypogaea]|uniref:Transposase MuDR plant domain-containing protein n=1 Tax=Arachis hypogaea TaxID=3818 RepID=A0A445CKM0_ARAHY|nr:hypothetical protein Ahy_A06g026491 [Arachis hypogaea]